MGKALDLILLGRPGVFGTGYESFGDLRVWLDDGAFTQNGTPEMTSMTNQAASGLSNLWSASNPYFIRNDYNGSGRLGFARADASELLDADVPETGFTAGYTLGIAVRRVAGTASCTVLGNITAAQGQIKFDVNDWSNQYGGFDFDTGTPGPSAFPTAFVTVVIVGPGDSRTYQNAVDISEPAPTTWTPGAPTDFEFSRTLDSSGSSQDWEFAGLYLYSGVLAIPQVNALGQQISDDFNGGQTWNVS